MCFYINFDNEIKIENVDAATFKKLIDEKKITNQGNNTGESTEGRWFNYSDVADSLIQIKTNEELLHYVNSN